MIKSTRATLAVVVLALAAACAGPQDAPGDPKKLVISGFGFASDRVEETVIKPFEQQTGIDVVMETGANADRLNKLRVNKNSPTVDVMLITDFFAAVGEQDGLFDRVDPAAVPNLSKVYDFAKNPDDFGPAYTYTLLGMVYRTDLVTQPPSMDLLTSPQYKGKVALPDTAITPGLPFLLALGEQYGSGPRDVDAAFRELGTMKPNVLKFFDRSTEVTSLLDRGEVVAAPGLDLFAVDLVQAGKPLAWQPFDKGRYLMTNRAEIVKGSKNKAGAEKFLNYLLSAQVQQGAAESFHDKPVNPDAKLPDILAKVSGTAANDPAAAGFHPVDMLFVVAHNKEWTDRFMREVSG
jgi:putative spermidine/putrescine transport system substrate-binding protein